MAYQQKEGQGSLFNNEKQKDRQPDFKGTIMIKGVLYDIAGWNRTSQNGREYLSLQASEKSADQGQYQQRSAGQGQWQGASTDTSRSRWQSGPSAAPGSTFQAPAPSMEDLPAENAEEDLPF